MTTAEKLAEARQAYHEIMTGQAVNRFIDQNGESVQYSRANIAALTAYIAKLEGELAGTPMVRGPLRFLFGRGW